jgi:hypothetical protein
MKHAILCGVILATGLSLNAQIGIPKLPKAPKVPSISGGSGASSSSSNVTNLSKVDLSPAAQAIKDYRNALSFAKDAVNGKNSDAGSRLDKLVPMLAKIKEQDPKWSEYDKDEADYKALRTQYEKDQAGANMSSKLQDMYFAVLNVEREPWNGWGRVEVLVPDNYKEIKAYYDAHPQDASSDFTQKALAKCAEFQPTILPKVKAEELKDLDEVMEKASRHIKENRSKPTYLDNQSVHIFADAPQGDVKTLEMSIKDCDVALRMLPGDADFTQRKSTILARIADLNTYVSSGEHAQMVAKRRQMDIDAERLGKPATTNAAHDAIVKRDFVTAEYGTIQRIVLLESDWSIIKNEFGLPLRKVLDVDVASKLEGKCYHVTGRLYCEYSGGGTYAAPKYYHDNKIEMNCANISK